MREGGDRGTILVGGGLDAAHKFLVFALGVIDHGDLGLGALRENGNFSGVVHAQFEDGIAVAFSQAKQSEWESNLVVKVSSGGQTPILASFFKEDGGQHLSDGRFAVASGDADDRYLETGSPAGCRSAQSRPGILNDDLRDIDGEFFFDDQSHCALFDRLIGKVMGIKAFSSKGKKERVISDTSCVC